MALSLTWWQQRLWRQRRRFLILPLMPLCAELMLDEPRKTAILIDVLLVVGAGVMIVLFAPKERHLTWPAIAAGLAILDVLDALAGPARLPLVVEIGLLYAAVYLALRYGLALLNRAMPVIRWTITGHGRTTLPPGLAFARMFDTETPWHPSISHVRRDGDRLMISRQGKAPSGEVTALIEHEDPPNRMVLSYLIAVPRQGDDAPDLETLPGDSDLVILDRAQDDVEFQINAGGTRMIRRATRNRALLQHLAEWLDDTPGQMLDTFAAVAEQRDDHSLSGADLKASGDDPDAPERAF